MAKGWISIHRKIQDSEIWNSSEPFDKRSAWIDLLLLANHEDNTIMIKNQKILLFNSLSKSRSFID